MTFEELLKKKREEQRRKAQAQWEATNPFEQFFRGFGGGTGEGWYYGQQTAYHDDPLYKHICTEAIEYFADLYKIKPNLLADPQFRAQLRPDMKERMFGFMQQRLEYWGKVGFVLPKEKKK